MKHLEILAVTLLILGAAIVGLGINAIEKKYESLHCEMEKLVSINTSIKLQLEKALAENKELKNKLKGKAAYANY